MFSCSTFHLLPPLHASKVTMQSSSSIYKYYCATQPQLNRSSPLNVLISDSRLSPRRSVLYICKMMKLCFSMLIIQLRFPLSTAASFHNGIFSASQTSIYELSSSVRPYPFSCKHTCSTDLQHHCVEQVS